MSARQETRTHTKRVTKTKRHVRCPNCGKYMGSPKGGKTFSTSSHKSSTSVYKDGDKTVTNTWYSYRKKTKSKIKVK